MFFSHCTLACLYCQNYRWSQDRQGEDLEVDGLVEILRGLARQGCHNWNLVSPTPWLPLVRDAVQRVTATGVRLPVVCNTSGFERVETLRDCEDLVDVYLTDLRYANPDSAQEGSGAAAYVQVARDALREMWRQKGALELGPHGTAQRGTIVRLLVLPGRAGEALANLEWLAGAIGNQVAVSVMAQYVPVHRAAGTAGWERRVTQEEYECVCAGIEDLGFHEGWVQEWGGETPKELLGFEMAGAKPAEETNGEHS